MAFAIQRQEADLRSGLSFRSSILVHSFTNKLFLSKVEQLLSVFIFKLVFMLFVELGKYIIGRVLFLVELVDFFHMRQSRILRSLFSHLEILSLLINGRILVVHLLFDLVLWTLITYCIELREEFTDSHPPGGLTR